MPSPDELERIEDLAEEILDIVRDDDGEPGVLAPPVGFTAVYDSARRRVAARWTGAPGAVSVQTHERVKDPNATLKATVLAAAGVRESSELAGGRYEWALRSVGPDGELSDFTEWIAIDVPRKGDDEPDEDDDEDPGEQPQPGGPHPSDVLPAMRTWTLTRPTGTEGDPDNDYLVGETVPGVCFVREDRGVVFRANAGGVTTENSNYPRSELREMADDDWTKESRSSSEPHVLDVDLAIDTRGLTKRRRISGMQIHDGGDDVIQLIHDADDGLGISYKDGDKWELVDRDYQDGARFNCRFVTVPRDPEEYDTDLIEVHYNGRVAAKIEARGSGWYDKVGAYVQSNVKQWGEAPSATGEVVVFGLTSGAP